MNILVRNVSGFWCEKKSSIIETGPSVIIPNIVAQNQQPQQSNQTPQQSNQEPQHSDLEQALSPTDYPDFVEYCSLGSILDPFTFPIGEHSFKIDFDLRINLGRTDEYEAVLVDCEPKSDFPSDYPLIFQSHFMLRFTNLQTVKFTVGNCRLILLQSLSVNGTLINHRNQTHIEYCRHININFELKSDLSEEIVSIQHHTTLLESTHEPFSIAVETLDEKDSLEEAILTKPTPKAATTLTASSEHADEVVGHSARRRSLNSCEDACYEISLLNFEISFDIETNDFKITNEDQLVFSKILDCPELLIDREIEIDFNLNSFVDVPKIRYESIPARYSSLPKRNNELH